MSPLIDGTCVLIPRGTIEAVGLLDERRFGRYGWGAIEDYCLRVQAAGGKVLISRRSFLTHQTGSTASTVMSRYHYFAAAEMHVSMLRKWGRRWPERFPGSRHQTPPLPELARWFARHGLTLAGLQGLQVRSLLRRRA